MSTTTERRPHAAALADAEAFRDLFPDSTFERWTIAGSVRRRKPECGDIEHVVVPRWGDIEVQAGLFAQTERTNILWHHLDSLVSGGVVAKHLYANGWKWGQLFRGVEYRNFCHEIHMADAENWGSKLAICTGPAEFSKRLVKGLWRNQMRNKDGRVWRCDPCPPSPAHCAPTPCRLCDGTGLVPREKVAVPDEREFFRLAGEPWKEAWERK